MDVLQSDEMSRQARRSKAAARARYLIGSLGDSAVFFFMSPQKKRVLPDAVDGQLAYMTKAEDEVYKREEIEKDFVMGIALSRV